MEDVAVGQRGICLDIDSFLHCLNDQALERID